MNLVLLCCRKLRQWIDDAADRAFVWALYRDVRPRRAKERAA